MSKQGKIANNHSTSNVFASSGLRSFFARMESSKKANTKASQFEIMVQYMTEQPDLCKGYLKTRDARQKSKHLWTNLSKDLNAEGPPQRDGAGWKKVWADLKVHTKAKIRKNSNNFSGTGGGPPKYHSLTPLEEKVSELLNLKKAIDGMHGALSFGVHNTSCNGEQHAAEENAVIGMDNVPYDEDALHVYEAMIDETQMETNENVVGKENLPQARMTPKRKQTSLLEKQVDSQIMYQNSMCAAMKEVNENLKGIFKYTRRDFELKEKKYKLKKESLEFKKQKFEKQSEIKKNKNAVAKLELDKEILRLRQQMNAPF